MINELPEELIDHVVVNIESIDDVRRFFAVSRKCHSIASKRRVSLMWVEKHKGVHLAFKHAVLLGDDVFAHEMIAKMSANERHRSLAVTLQARFASSWITALMIDATSINRPVFFTNGTVASLLHIARTADAARVLLAVPGIIVNLLSSKGATPLHMAACFDYEEVVVELLRVPGILINAQVRNRGLTALHFAVAGGYTRIVQMLLAAPGIQVNTPDIHGNTPLHVAVVTSVDVTRVLIADPRVNFNMLNQQGRTPLWIAARKGNVDIVQTLLATGGVNANISDVNGSTIVHAAACSGHKATLAAVMAATDAIMIGVRDINGLSPLHVAAASAKLESVKLLLSAPSVVVDVCDNDLNTPLHFAAKAGSVEIITAIMATGVDITWRNMAGDTPLHVAVRHNHTPVVAQLLSVAPETSINIPGEGFQTPLHIAVKNGNMVLAGVIVVCCPSVDVNAQDDLGETPLHIAVKLNHTGIMAMLLGHDGINLRIKDNRRREALYYAADSPEAFKMLATHRHM